jgi:hypothetical protein
VKILAPIIVFYFLIIYPTIHLAFSGNKFLYDHGHIFYFALAITVVLAFKHASVQQLGFNKNNIGKSLTIGILLGGLPVLGVSLLDALFIKLELTQSELFAGANLRNPQEMGFETSPWKNIFPVLIVPFIDQVFVLGLIVNNLFIKENFGRFIISGGLIYSLLHFDLAIGSLFLGMLSAGLMKSTGSIIVPILVHTGFIIAELSIVVNHPRLISILVFFV